LQGILKKIIPKKARVVSTAGFRYLQFNIK